jgi:PleD family two-component response regulator
LSSSDGDQLSGARFNLEKMSILVVDGDTMSQAILTQILSGFGAKSLKKCTTSEEARQAVATSTYDLIVVDPSIAESEGYEFISSLRRDLKSASRFAPVLMITGHTQYSKIAAARDCGANFVVVKPLTPQIVRDRIMWMAKDIRPFVECKVYAGPDRRFKFDGPPPGSAAGRRQEDKDMSTDLGDAIDPNLTQKAIDDLMQPRKVFIPGDF